ncbi:MAG: glycosyltransferase family 4 protein [Pseudomonadota bacterium]
MELLESIKLRRSEAQALRQFDSVLVCSELERELIFKRTRTNKLSVFPNGIRIPNPAGQIESSSGTDQARRVILFVGSLDFYPNVEGLLWMARGVLPLLRQSDPRPFRLVVVGRNPDERLIALAREGLFELHAEVPEVAPYYASASIVVAPIHAGSGTRIKILEAFAFGVPVVSTTIGAEGLSAENGIHLAIGDTPAAFARQIDTLLGDPAQRRHLNRNASQLIEKNFSLDAICQKITALVE